jgi:hypothetical protein
MLATFGPVEQVALSDLLSRMMMSNSASALSSPPVANVGISKAGIKPGLKPVFKP